MTISVDDNLVKPIIEYFRNKGLSDYAIAGILGNWYVESHFRPNNAQNSYMNAWHMTDEEYTSKVDNGTWVKPNTSLDFDADAVGYGLAQWTSKGRKAGLHNLCKSRGVSISDLQAQLDWAWTELTSSGYKYVYEICKNSTDLEEIAVAFMVYFERPSGVKDPDKRKYRADLAKELYARYFNKEEKMKASELVAKAIDIATNYKTLYVLGCFGAPLNDKNKVRYTNNQEYNGKPVDKYIGTVNGVPQYVKQTTAEGLIRKKMIESATADTFGFDCVCLIKGILWGWSGNVDKTYGGATYVSNNVPDVGADAMMNRYCKMVSSDFSNIMVGEAVWIPGHIGIYIGDGKVVECTPKFENKVQITNLGNVGNKSGNYRTWTKHGMIPWVEYDVLDAPAFVPTIETSNAVGKRTYTVVKGDTLTKIAARFNTTIDKIIEDNLQSHKTMTRNHIVAGWKLKV